MPKSKRNTKSRWGKTDLRRVDAHIIQPHEYNEAPELTAEQLAGGRLERGGIPVRRGRPRLDHPKQHVSLRLDPDVVAYYRRQGRGWQGEINAVLKRAISRARKRA